MPALVAAAHQVALVGDDAQRAAAADILSEATRRIYALLAVAPTAQAAEAATSGVVAGDPELGGADAEQAPGPVA